jgi:transposase
VIKVDQYAFIRTAHRVYGKSIHEIQRETGHSRTTIRKVLRGEYREHQQRERRSFPVLGPHREKVEEWLRADKEEPVKQRHTARRIYSRLVNECGYQGSEEAVRRYVRLAKARLGLDKAGVYIITDPACGKEAEVDWFYAVAVIKGVRVPIKCFCMRSRYSGKPFVRAYACEKQQAFFDAHIHGFAFFGGIFPTLVYDNLTSAVQKVLSGRQRQEQDTFIRFRSYYNFTPRFCNVASPHEKGGVEGTVGFIRRNYLVPIPEADSFEALNHYLLEACCGYGSHRILGKDETVDVLFERERGHLISVPDAPFSNMFAVEGKVNKYATVMVDKNHYSVPYSYVGLKVRIQLWIDRVEVFYESKKIGSHERVYANNKWQLEPQHYLEILRQRPGAFESSRVIQQWRSTWPKELESLLDQFRQKQGETHGIKDFICVLMLYREYPKGEVDTAIELAAEKRVSHSEGVKHFLVHSKQEKSIEPEPLVGWSPTLEPDIEIYNQLGGVSCPTR